MWKHNLLIDLIDIVHDMTIGYENVFITIVVVIEEIDSPAEIVIGNFSYTRRNGDIGKKFAVLITIKGGCLVLKVDDGQVEQTVVVVVTKTVPMPASSSSIRGKRHRA